MRRLFLCVLVSSACFSPDDGSADGTDSTNATTSGSDTSGNGMTSPSSTAESTIGTTMSTEETADPTDTSETTTAVDETTTTEGDESSSSDSGAQPGCAGFDGRVIYIDMDGATLTNGLVDNAPADIINDEFLAREWGPYTTDDADEVYALVEGHFAPFHVCLTRELPQVPDYTKIVVSSETFQDNPNFIGTNHEDCGDAVSNSVNVVVLSEEAGLAATTKAIGISKFTARVFGLDSVVDAEADIMNQFVGNTLNGAAFTETCYPKIATAVCDSNVACAVDEQQSGPYLEGIFGPA